MSLAEECALLDIPDDPERQPPREVQRRLRDGRCVVCDLLVSRRQLHARQRPARTALCDHCEVAGWHWCSPGQHVARHAAFHRSRNARSGLTIECRDCRAERRRRRIDRTCARPGCTAMAARTGRSWHKLCTGCLARFAWCGACKRPRRRQGFPASIRAGKVHAGTCHACNAARKRTGAMVAKQAAAQERYRAISAYAEAHPEQTTSAIGAIFGVCQDTVLKALKATGLRRGHSTQRVAALARWREALALESLSVAEMAAQLNITRSVADHLRRNARQARERGEL